MSKKIKKGTIVIAIVLVTATALNVVFHTVMDKRGAAKETPVMSSSIFTVRTEKA